MVTVFSKSYVQGTGKCDFTFKGINSDQKPILEVGGDAIADNSLFIELDTGDFYYYQDFEESVVAEKEYDYFYQPQGKDYYVSILLQTTVSDDTIIVDWGGVKYLCQKEIVAEGVWTYGDHLNGGDPTFTNYPFVLYFKPSDFDVARAIMKPTSGNVTMSVSKQSGTWNKFGGKE